ncbi:UV radiation resistance protein and autophagy-related subunit 14-domain-containing protein [Desarmillaria tabescens]|uniref:Autophagy-related protein 14 n=1 Tax=Armillaria tabescens TaxID=1929756 RepID=A0AA39JTR0_ARMTA|nr:UV radiation resistance protein and autophagy-related subunit 14-domain-containing protein [Desarmillaria tabescens]KAK0446428.1 UV radiation resistance protein and autophagy-related subunit 14-domain-containing protein [Desarmillaria tabescens]
MLAGSHAEAEAIQDGTYDVLSQKRIRHITSIQVRNLTPFPVRDEFASALSQPSEQPQFSTHGHLTDDLDISLTLKRSRRVSANSVATFRSKKSEDVVEGQGSGDSAAISRGRTRAGSRASSAGVSSKFASGSAPTIRRHRASSNASSLAATLSGPDVSALASTSAAPYNTLFHNHTQTELESVIRTRLVETFLSIIVHSPHNNVPEDTTPSPSPRRPAGTFRPPVSRGSSGLKTKKLNGAENVKSHRPTISNVERATYAPRTAVPKSLSSTHLKSASTSALRTNGQAPPPVTKCSTPSPRSQSESRSYPVPDFLSPIHPPSTNPTFRVDPQNDFSTSTDITGGDLTVQVWACMPERKNDTSGKGKGRPIPDETEWKLLETWDFNLEELIPVPEDFSHISQLPSNTLLITLDPPGHDYYLLSTRIPRNRTPSPSAGYASDPETGTRRVRHIEDIFSTETPVNAVVSTPKRYRRGTRRKSQLSEDYVQTASWRDLFKLVTLQACIHDTYSSLDEVARSIDKFMEDDVTFKLRRRVDECEARLEELQSNFQHLQTLRQQREWEIKSRRDRLRQRRETLELARKQLLEGSDHLDSISQSVIEERSRFDVLQNQIKPTRTTLLSTLSWIFPIELRSPPDLLYTVLDVPLPIPFSSSDPGPPLFLISHNDVNEDSVATALGYAAQLVQFIAVYLGKGLVYPVTFVGSRSLIRDGISAMVGPRMFPLFSKGVDTYRFEYGVFLLNKDIELLMSDYDLRALDMRHTLPNLKNLLLTLTNGEGLPVGPSRPFNSPALSVSGLESPRSESPVGESPATPKPVYHELPFDNSTPPASGSTTPTTMDGIKKGRAFINLNPLAGFLSLRSRYPTSLMVKSPSDGEGAHANGNTPDVSSEDAQEEGGGVPEEDDRRTIRCESNEGERADEDKRASNGYWHGGESSGSPGPEKINVEEDRHPSPAPPTPSPPIVAHA